MATEFSLKDLLPGGGWVEKVIALVVDGVTEQPKRKLIEELQAGRPIAEVHTKAGLRFDQNNPFQKRDCLMGQMTLPPNGNWVCYAVWKTDGKLYQGSFRVSLDPDPSKTTLSLQISSPPGTPATTFTVLDAFYKYDVDASPVSGLTIAGEVSVTYRDTQDNVRTLKFTSSKRSVV